MEGSCIRKDPDRLKVVKSEEFWEAVKKGKYALFCDGEFVGAFDSEEEMMREAAKHGMCYAMHETWALNEGELTGVF
jgi:hypothetical protein